MSSRFQIKDSASNTVTVKLEENWSDYNGLWMPDTPGKVSSSREPANNTYDAENVDGVPYNANLYYTDSLGRRHPVMILNGIIGTILYEDSGTGYLYYLAATSLKGGTVNWKKL